MSRTAYDEHFGASLDLTTGASGLLRLPDGIGGCRFYVLRPTAPGLTFDLPFAVYCSVGSEPLLTVLNHGAHSLTVRTAFLGTTVATVAVGEAARIWLVDRTTLWGTWYAEVSSAEEGTPLVADREPCDLLITGVHTALDLREYAGELGYEEQRAYSVTARLANDAVIGSHSTAVPALDSGVWHPDTTMRLFLSSGSRIVGRGGDGGDGGSPGVDTGTGSNFGRPGGAGGHGLVLRLDCALSSYGKIQGGGGGGAGGAATQLGGQFPGGGGGGGAGYSPSAGGRAGSVAGVPWNGGGGRPGYPDVPGAGGGTPAQNGQAGGGPGQAGGHSSAGILGGAAGHAIRVLTGKTVTKLRAGTIDGAEVSF